MSILPEWVGNPDLDIYKVEGVRVQKINPNGTIKELEIRSSVDNGNSSGGKTNNARIRKFSGKMFTCFHAQTISPDVKKQTKGKFGHMKLNDKQIALLTGNVESLTSQFVPTKWDPYFCAIQVNLLVDYRKKSEDCFDGGRDVKFQFGCESSDDSDGFADDED